MADLATQTVPVDSGEIDLIGALAAAAGGGDTAEVGEGLFFVANNASVSTITITIATPGTFHGLAIPDVTMAVLTEDVGIIPLSGIFRGAAGRAVITYDDVTTLTVGVFKLGS